MILSTPQAKCKGKIRMFPLVAGKRIYWWRAEKICKLLWIDCRTIQKCGYVFCITEQIDHGLILFFSFSFVVINRNTLMMTANLHFSGFNFWHWILKLLFSQSQFLYVFESVESRDLSRDDWIEEFIKRKWSSGLVWAVGAAEKKNFPTAISMQLFVGKKNI